MSLLRTKNYHFQRETVIFGTGIYVFVAIVAFFYFKDALVISYGLMIPTFVYLYFMVDQARVTKLPFWSLRGFVEVGLAFAVAASIPFIGYRLWLMGY